jgi:MOSC domain-containing protein YiiM
VQDGQHRRNIVTRGVDLRSLSGRAFRIGGATFAYDRPRPPCRYIEGLTEPGMTRALAARRGGICVRVVESGVVRPGDEIELLPVETGFEPPRPGPIHRASNRA